MNLMRIGMYFLAGMIVGGVIVQTPVLLLLTGFALIFLMVLIVLCELFNVDGPSWPPTK